MANKQQQKKSSSATTSSATGATAASSSSGGNNSNTSESKKPAGEAGEESNTMASSGSAPSDVYEFVSTPKHSSCSSGDENPIGKSFDKSSDDKSGTDSDTPSISASSAAATAPTSSSVTANVQQKRALGDQVDRNDDSLSPADEDSKRKKRKDTEFTAKETTGGSSSSSSKATASTSSNQAGNRNASRVGKPPGPASKTMGLMNKTSNVLDRKSESPKMSTTVKSPAEADADNDEMKSNTEGPKVPPLKIVIPQQSSSSSGTNETQDGAQNANQRANKTVTARNTASNLPYVINSSANPNENSGSVASVEKDSANNTTISVAPSSAVPNVVLGSLLRSQSPSADSNKSNDESKPANSSSKSKEPRILRSSQRSGKDSKDDRSSNNSSPQLPVSSTPSPAAQNTDSSAGTESDHQQITNATASQSSQPTNSVSLSSSTTSSAGNSQPSTSTQQPQTASNSNQSNSSQSGQQQQQHQQQQPSVTGTASSSGVTASSSSSQNSVELHPRKRKIKASSKEPQNSSSSSSSSSASSTVDIKDSNSKDGQEKSNEPVHPHDQPFTNCYQMYIDLRKQIEQRHKNLHPIEPRPLKGLEDYLMNRRTYSLQGKTPIEPPNIIIPPLLPTSMKETFVEQEKERHRLKMKHIVEKEKLVLSKEQEILRVHCKAAQMQANQPQPFSVCTILKDVEVYNPVTPEHEERYNNRSFFKELKDLDDKWDKIKEAMIIRHTNESESLHAVQKMDWGWKLKELALCDYKATPEIEELHVPMVDVSDEYTTPSIKN